MSPFGDWEGGVDAARVTALSRGLREDGVALSGLSTVGIAERLGRVSAAWLSGAGGYLERAVEGGAATTGLSVEMLRWSLTELMRRMTPRSLVALVAAELGMREPFEAPRHVEGAVCARAGNPPGLVLQVMAGTVPTVAIETMVLGLLSRGPVLLKTASSDPVIARVFLESLRAEAPALARHVAVLTWDGGDAAVDAAACEQASVVVAYGGDDAVNALMSRCRFPTRFFGYGHRVSVAVIGPHDAKAGDGEAALEGLARDIALDVAAYDQRGCMSPHVVFVVDGAPWSARAVAQSLGDKALPWAATRWPRGAPSEGFAAQLVQLRGVAEFMGDEVFGTDAGVVVLRSKPAFVASPGGRVVSVVPVTEAEMYAALAPVAGSISTVRLRWPSVDRAQVMTRLGRLGARRICRLGRMQRPIWLRAHDGRPRLGDWIEWTDVEP